MAAVAFTVAAGGNAGAQFRHIAKAIEKAVAHMPDAVGSGASSTLTITEGTGPLGIVRVTAGPYAKVSGSGIAEASLPDSPTVQF